MTNGFLDACSMFVVQLVRACSLPGEGDFVVVPASMNDAHIGAFQRQGQLREKAEDAISRSLVDPNLRPGCRGVSGRQLVMEKPDIIGFAAAEEDVQLVIAQHALRPLAVHKSADTFEDGGTIRAAVYQVADEDETAAFGMAALGVVTKSLQQRNKGIDFAVNIANYVDGSVEERSYQR